MKSGLTRFLKSDWAIFFFLMVLAVVPRIYLLLVTHKYSSDGVSYLSTALYLRDPELVGEVPKRIYFILYPSMVLLFDNLINDIAMSGRILNFLVGVFIPPLAYLIGIKFLTRKTAFVTGLFCVLNPLLIEQSAEIRGDNLFALMTLLSIYTFESLDWKVPKVRNALLLALVVGLSQLARTNGIMYLLVIIPIWIVWVRRGQIPLKPWIINTLVPFLVLFFIIFSIPHILLKGRGESLPSMFVYTYLDGNIAATSDREEMFFKLNLDATEYQFLEDVSKTGMKDLLNDWSILPGKYLRNFVYCLRLVFDPIIVILLRMCIFLLPLLFYVFYYWGEVKIPSHLKRIVFWAWPSFFLLPAINIENLYFLPLIPVLMLVLAWIFDVSSNLGWIAKWNRIIFLLLCLTVLVPEISMSRELLINEKNFRNPYPPAGKWIQENSNTDDTIMARNPEVFFHALRHGYRMPMEDINRTLIFANHVGVRYLVFGPLEIEKRKSLFFSLYEEIVKKGDDSRVKVVNTVDTGGNLVYVLELVPENFKVTEMSVTEIPDE